MLFFAGLFLVGGLVRGFEARRLDHGLVGPGDGGLALAEHLQRVDSVAAVERAGRRGARRGGRQATTVGPSRGAADTTYVLRREGGGAGAALVDVDRADAASLATLPGIGPALAARIIAVRDSVGPFGELSRLRRVKGIGPKLLERLAPRVTFSGTARP
jgi:competence ComEA-like helix-hairpin-helix protein